MDKKLCECGKEIERMLGSSDWAWRRTIRCDGCKINSYYAKSPIKKRDVVRAITRVCDKCKKQSPSSIRSRYCIECKLDIMEAGRAKHRRDHPVSRKKT